MPPAEWSGTRGNPEVQSSPSIPLCFCSCPSHPVGPVQRPSRPVSYRSSCASTRWRPPAFWSFHAAARLSRVQTQRPAPDLSQMPCIIQPSLPRRGTHSHCPTGPTPTTRAGAANILSQAAMPSARTAPSSSWGPRVCRTSAPISAVGGEGTKGSPHLKSRYSMTGSETLFFFHRYNHPEASGARQIAGFGAGQSSGAVIVSASSLPEYQRPRTCQAPQSRQNTTSASRSAPLIAAGSNPAKRTARRCVFACWQQTADL